jgi:hypothetical protein
MFEKSPQQLSSAKRNQKRQRISFGKRTGSANKD